MKQFIISLSVFFFVLSACGNVGAADPVTVAASPDNTPWVTYTPSPYPGSIATTPTLAAGANLPTCIFPLAGTTAEESAPENYLFSEPRVVPTDSSSSFEIIQWLPDSERALIVERLYENQTEASQSIQLFNPQTLNIQVYAGRAETSYEAPMWVEGLKAVIYREGQIVSSSFENGMVIPSSIVERQQLWISSGNPDLAQNLRDVEFHPAIAPHEQIIFSLAAKPDSSRIVSLEGDGAQRFQIIQREVIQGLLGTEQQVPFDTSALDGPDDLGPLNRLTRMTWQPGTSHVFFYNYISLTDPTFLLDVETGQSCGLEFDGWVYGAHWSPNGRYLAVIKSRAAMIPFTLDYDLVVLDAVTGTLYQVDAKKLSPPDMIDIGVHKVIALTWAPDNRHIAAVGSVSFAGSSPPPSTERLFLIDFLSGSVDPLFTSYEFDLQCLNWDTGLAWSPDGSKLLAACPEIRLITVQKTN